MRARGVTIRAKGFLCCGRFLFKEENSKAGWAAGRKRHDTHMRKFLVSYLTKVIIDNSRGEVSLVEQDTIEHVSVAYLKFTIIFLRIKKKNSPSLYAICQYVS
jgi:hypothetical protein